MFNPPETMVDQILALDSAHPGLVALLILVDDASTNGVVEQIVRRFPGVDVVRGSGDLWWGGGITVGMRRALEMGAEVVVWLNHDCIPDPGTIGGLVNLASEPGVGAVSAWCYCQEDCEFGVNPGFRNFKEIPLEELRTGAVIEVDGLNGNCTAISARAILKVGLPRADLHPHYGDGPYTWRLRKAGFRNLVATPFRASLHREFDRCVSAREHSSLWRVSLLKKLVYHLFSFRSKNHWKHKFHDLCVFRGKIIGLLLYPIVQFKLIGGVVAGHVCSVCSSDEQIEKIVRKYNHRFPPDALARDLRSLARRAD